VSDPTPHARARRSARRLGRRGRLGVAAVATATIATLGLSLAASAASGLGLTEVAAQPRADGIASPNAISPELIEFVQAQGSWVLENPSKDGVIKYYGYLADGNPLVPTTTLTPPAEAQKTEPDKNTYLVIKGQHGPDAKYGYGQHFLYQGHEGGPRGYITRINLDADPAHRVTLLASTQAAGNLPADTDLPTFDGSVWDPFTKSLFFSAEGNGSSTGGLWEATPDFPSTVVDRLGIFGRGGFEGIQIDDDGNLWIVEDIGGKTGTASGATLNAKQPNSFVFRFVPKDRTDISKGGKLQVLQADGKDGKPVTFTGDPVTGVPSQAQADADITSAFMHDLHTYGNSFSTRWITVHDTATDGTTTFNANVLAKTKGGTPFKRPENGQFRPDAKFHEFVFTETGDTNATSGANADHGGWGGLLRLVQSDPSAATGTLRPAFIGDQAHTGLDNLTFLDKDTVLAVEDAGDTLHGQRNALDSAYAIRIPSGSSAPTPFRWLGEGRDAAATIDAANGGFALPGPPVVFRNDGDNEITGIHLSDGDPTIKGLIGTDTPRFLHPGNGHDDWRLFWTQQHGDNVTYEVVPAP